MFFIFSDLKCVEDFVKKTNKMLTSLLSNNNKNVNKRIDIMEHLSKIQNISQKLGTAVNVPQFVLIGTQSAGKTTLINKLSGFTCDLFASDKT